MSRIGKKIIIIPRDVRTIVSSKSFVIVEGAKGRLTRKFNNLVTIKVMDNSISVNPVNNSKAANTQSGTAQSLLNNMIKGVSIGFEKRLNLVGIGYRARIQSNTLNLVLGFSHPINYILPKNISAETPSQTEILLKGIDKELLGKVAAEIRSYRKPEVYKGKGIRYLDERVITKEAKKK